MNVLFVGHRCVGKTTTAALVAELLNKHHIDIDHEVLTHMGVSPADYVARDEPAFRAHERELTNSALQGDGVVVSAGAGLDLIPNDVLVVWLERDGWQEDAAAKRARLRRDLPWESEVAWMIETREPRYRSAAHLRYRTPRGRAAARVADDIATYLRWLEAAKSALATKHFVVPMSASERERAQFVASIAGLGGTEARSDTLSVDETPPAALVSLRTDDPYWLAETAQSATAIDVDVEYLDALFASEALTLPPRPLVLSLHATNFDPSHVSALASAARRVQTVASKWRGHVGVKYAPQLESFDDLGMARAALAPLRKAGVPTTLIPQGRDWAWTRALLADSNQFGYIAAALRSSDADATPAWDLQDALPHLVAPRPVSWAAVVGDPVASSQGPRWHRRSAIHDGLSESYVPVKVAPGEFVSALRQLGELGVDAVSVTSPLKREASFIKTNDADFGPVLSERERWLASNDDAPVRPGNTLFRQQTWLATDTDEEGLVACLTWLEDNGIGPGTIALFGGGGVKPAILRAIESRDWFLAYAVRARDGWPPGEPPFATLVINAAGPGSTAHEAPPRSRAWLDLHYVDVAVPRSANGVHLNGDRFFDAQARAQREFWRAHRCAATPSDNS